MGHYLNVIYVFMYKCVVVYCSNCTVSLYALLYTTLIPISISNDILVEYLTQNKQNKLIGLEATFVLWMIKGLKSKKNIL